MVGHNRTELEAGMPTTCPQCGAPLGGIKCAYCATNVAINSLPRLNVPTKIIPLGTPKAADGEPEGLTYSDVISWMGVTSLGVLGGGVITGLGLDQGGETGEALILFGRSIVIGTLLYFSARAIEIIRDSDII